MSRAIGERDASPGCAPTQPVGGRTCRSISQPAEGSRTSNTLRNLRYGAILQLLALLAAFVSRTVFIRTLGSEYLGIEGLFTNVLTVLSLAELGVGSALSYALYGPIARNDTARIQTLMAVFRRFYTAVGVFILLSGVAIAPLIHLLMSDVPDLPHLQLIFVLFAVNSGVSYFAAYKRNLLIADQKQYVATLYRYSVYLVMCVAQICILLLTGSYLLYLTALISFTVLENVLVTLRADREYPFLKSRDIAPLLADERRVLMRNIRATSYHRVAGVVLTGTDSIVISKFVGVVSTGLYSNYLIIATALGKLFSLGFNAVTASIGNLGVTASTDRNYEVYRRLNFLTFWLYSVTTVSLAVCLNPFIALWAGVDYQLGQAATVIFVVNFYLQGMRGSVLACKNAYGLFWQDRYKPVAEMLTNLVFSVLLAPRFGVAGVLMGTVLAFVLTCSWVEPLVVFKYGFARPVAVYFGEYFVQLLVVTSLSLGTVLAVRSLPFAGVVGLVIRLVAALGISNFGLLVFYGRTKEFVYVQSLIRDRLAWSPRGH